MCDEEGEDKKHYLIKVDSLMKCKLEIFELQRPMNKLTEDVIIKRNIF